jgi:hypothetical protein
MLGEERPKVHEILQASRNAVELEANDDVDLARGDIPLQSLKLGSILVLRRPPGIDVKLMRRDIPVFTPGSEFDLLLDLMLLGN